MTGGVDATPVEVAESVEWSGKRVAEDATLAFGTQIVAYVAGLAASVVLARALGPADRGTYAVAVTAAGIAFVVFHAGIELASSYFFAERKVRLDPLARNGFFSALVLGPVAVLAMLALYWLAHRSVFRTLDFALYLCAILTLPFSLHQSWLSNLYLLAGRLRSYFVIVGAIALIQLLIVVVVWATGALGLTAAVVMYVAITVLGWILTVVGSRDFAPVGPPYDLSLFRAVLRYGLRLHFGYVGWFVLLRLDLFLVAWWLGVREAGIYAIAVVFAELAWQLTNPLASAAVRSQMSGSSEDAAHISFRVARMNLLIAAALAVIFAATLWIAVPVLYGSAFSHAYVAIVVLLPGVVVMAAFRPLYNWLVRVASPVRLSAVCVSAAVLNVGLNALVLRPWGLVGAAVTSTVSYCFLTAVTAKWASAKIGIDVDTALRPTRADARAMTANLKEMAERLRRAIAVRRRRGSG